MKKDIERKLEKDLREKLLLLPDYAADYIESVRNIREIRTRIEYSRDLLTFFDFLRTYLEKDEITEKDLEQLRKADFNNYLDYLSEYEKKFTTPTGKETVQVFTNRDVGKARKLATLHEFYQYLFEENLISRNDASKVSIHVKKRTKIKDMLTPRELRLLFDTIMNEDNISSRMELLATRRQKHRDFAIVSLLSYSGIRVGELIQLDMDNLSIEHEAIVVTRKGGDEEKLVLPQEVIQDMEEFLKERREVKTSEKALFLSQQNKRMHSRTINNMLQKYGERCGFEFKLTPHVFRRTFGTTHYNLYGDISMTGKLLGHKSTETTRRFYAEVSDKRVDESMKKFTYDIDK